MMRRPAWTSYSIPALEASEFARAHGAFDAFHEGTYRAFWEFGEDVGKTDVLQGVARQVGLDAEALGFALEQGQYRTQVEQDIQEAVGLGVHAIPSFLMGKYFFSGARPYEFFRSLMLRVLEE